MMLCPECRVRSTVIETRRNAAGVRRRYECSNEHRFSTYETLMNPPPKPPKPQPKPVLSPLVVAPSPSLSIWDLPPLVLSPAGAARAGADDHLKIKSRGF
jgi:hypothetical protein